MSYTEERAKTYQKPKADHPWRTYKNKKKHKGNSSERNIKEVRIFIQEIAESWNEMTIVTSMSGKEGKWKLNELPQTKQALWLASFLRKYYG